MNPLPCAKMIAVAVAGAEAAAAALSILIYSYLLCIDFEAVNARKEEKL
jgi:enolase